MYILFQSNQISHFPYLPSTWADTYATPLCLPEIKRRSQAVIRCKLMSNLIVKANELSNSTVIWQCMNDS